eukprot:1078418-Pyramimonas_sp.AAC.1
MQETQVCSHDRPNRYRKHRYTLTTDQSDAGSAGIFSRRTNRTQALNLKSPKKTKWTERITSNLRKTFNQLEGEAESKQGKTQNKTKLSGAPVLSDWSVVRIFSRFLRLIGDVRDADKGLVPLDAWKWTITWWWAEDRFTFIRGT